VSLALDEIVDEYVVSFKSDTEPGDESSTDMATAV
jgi:hypothetical protein